LKRASSRTKSSKRRLQQSEVREIAALDENFHKIGHRSAPQAREMQRTRIGEKGRLPPQRRAPPAGVNGSPASPQLNGLTSEYVPAVHGAINRSRGAFR
jgi:hypothetical protein